MVHDEPNRHPPPHSPGASSALVSRPGRRRGPASSRPCPPGAVRLTSWYAPACHGTSGVKRQLRSPSPISAAPPTFRPVSSRTDRQCCNSPWSRGLSNSTSSGALEPQCSEQFNRQAQAGSMRDRRCQCRCGSCVPRRLEGADPRRRGRPESTEMRTVVPSTSGYPNSRLGTRPRLIRPGVQQHREAFCAPASHSSGSGGRKTSSSVSPVSSRVTLYRASPPSPRSSARRSGRTPAAG